MKNIECYYCQCWMIWVKLVMEIWIGCILMVVEVGMLQLIKPNLHGYGHPNPPNERERRHRDQRRTRQHQQLQQVQQQQLQAQAQAQQLQQAQQAQQQQLQQHQPLSAAQLHQQKLQHLVNRPLPPIKQESQSAIQSGNGHHELLNNNLGDQHGGKHEGYSSRPDQYQQQQMVAEEEETKGSGLNCVVISCMIS